MKAFLVVLGIVTAIALILWQSHLPVQAQVSPDSRINRIETELVGIRIQLNQLAASRSTPGVSVPTPSPSRNPQRTNPPSNANYDRLATLVIELKERVNALEAKVAKLER